MQAHNDVKRVFNGVIARLVPVAARLRLADRIDALVAGWLERCAADAEAAQRFFSFRVDRNAADDGFDVGPAASSVSHP
jgi:hypothetical protein